MLSRAHLFALILATLPVIGASQTPCTARDFMAIALPTGDPVQIALETAYPGVTVDPDAGTFTTAEGGTIPLAPMRDIGAAQRLEGSTIGDQFAYLYPLDFNLAAREVPFNDPGRPRNDAFFRALYGNSEGEVRGHLTPVRFDGQRVSATFQVTARHCVAAQLEAALAVLETMSPEVDINFETPGGSFNWRVIAGTERLSSHSFGAAIDLNSEIGGYWRWSGRPEGDAGPFENRMPQALVETFERYGFIWGGKWHHFDGMHFEYRPELILYARLAG